MSTAYCAPSSTSEAVMFSPLKTNDWSCGWMRRRGIDDEDTGSPGFDDPPLLNTDVNASRNNSLLAFIGMEEQVQKGPSAHVVAAVRSFLYEDLPDPGGNDGQTLWVPGCKYT